MALEAKTKKIILISVGILVLAGLAFLIYKLAQPADTAPPVPPGSEVVDKPGLLDTATTYFCKAFPNSKFCGGAGKTDPCASVECDPNRDGWDIQGFPNNCCS